MWPGPRDAGAPPIGNVLSITPLGADGSATLLQITNLHRAIGCREVNSPHENTEGVCARITAPTLLERVNSAAKADQSVAVLQSDLRTGRITGQYFTVDSPPFLPTSFEQNRAGKTQTADDLKPPGAYGYTVFPFNHKGETLIVGLLLMGDAFAAQTGKKHPVNNIDRLRSRFIELLDE